MLTFLGFIRFKLGTYAQLSPVIAFHTYLNQSDRHKYYDDFKQGTGILKILSPLIVSSVLGMPLRRSKKLINFYEATTQWDEGGRDFLVDEVFALDPKAT